MKLSISALALVGALTTGTVYAEGQLNQHPNQDTNPQYQDRSSEQFDARTELQPKNLNTNQGLQTPILASDLIDKDVEDSQGREVGEVEDVVIDQTGKKIALIVEVGGFLGMGEKSVSIPMSELTIIENADNERTIQINHTKRELESMPTWTEDNVNQLSFR